MTFCPHNILSATFCPWHFIRRHFVLEPAYYICLSVGGLVNQENLRASNKLFVCHLGSLKIFAIGFWLKLCHYQVRGCWLNFGDLDPSPAHRVFVNSHTVEHKSEYLLLYPRESFGENSFSLPSFMNLSDIIRCNCLPAVSSTPIAVSRSSASRLWILSNFYILYTNFALERNWDSQWIIYVCHKPCWGKQMGLR